MKTKYLLVILALSSLIFYACNTTNETQSQEKASFIAKFYPLEESTTVQEKHPLVFLFGGSEGGMPYQKSDKTCIDDLHKKGYHVVTVAYFNYKDLPKDLNRIPLDRFKKTLEQYRHLPSVDPQATAVIGTSKGGELVLNLASI